jgi:hypothetical protein
VVAECKKVLKKKKKKNEYVCERVFITSYEYISAVFLLRLLDYAMRNDETNAIDMERKWRVTIVAVLESKQRRSTTSLMMGFICI